jgi:Family of unknown function (DUF6356)
VAVTRHFTDHPASVGESYGEHFRVAVGFARDLFGAAAACMVHAVVPALCTRTASSTIDELHDRIHSGARGRITPTAEMAV